MECFGGDVNRTVWGDEEWWMVDGLGWGLDRVGLGLVGLG